MTILDRLGLRWPIIQAPMAGTSTPELAAAVSEAGGLGSIGVGAVDAVTAAEMIAAIRARTDRPFNVNLFAHTPDQPNPDREAGWIEALTPLFHEAGAQPPTHLRAIYRSFIDDDDMLAMLIDMAPTVVSLHFGLPSADRIIALKQAGCLLFSTATSLDEARAARDAGIDMVVAQGWEAGGHRGMFDPTAADDRLGALALTRILVRDATLPVIAAGGIMDGAGIAAALDLGAVAAQLGTAFIACPESSADAGYRAALASEAARHTVMVDAISGRPARCLANRFTSWAIENGNLPRPGYPMTYDAGKALNAAAKAIGDFGFGAQWAGQGAPLARAMPAAEMIATLGRELEAANGR